LRLEFDRFARLRSWLARWLIRVGMVRAAVKVIPGAGYKDKPTRPDLNRS
jgi:hypothetical protein